MYAHDLQLESVLPVPVFRCKLLENMSFVARIHQKSASEELEWTHKLLKTSATLSESWDNKPSNGHPW